MRSVTVWLDHDLLSALERFISDMESVASREEALRAAFRDWAVSRGYLADLHGTAGLRMRKG